MIITPGSLSGTSSSTSLRQSLSSPSLLFKSFCFLLSHPSDPELHKSGASGTHPTHQPFLSPPFTHGVTITNSYQFCLFSISEVYSFICKHFGYFYVVQTTVTFCLGYHHLIIQGLPKFFHVKTTIIILENTLAGNRKHSILHFKESFLHCICF